MFALEELKEGIQKQTDEVWSKIDSLEQTSEQWKFSHNLNEAVCASVRSNAFAAFQRWSLVQPCLRTWMACDSQVCNCNINYNYNRSLHV
jgi:hypothetical protein